MSYKIAVYEEILAETPGVRPAGRVVGLINDPDLVEAALKRLYKIRRNEAEHLRPRRRKGWRHDR